MKIRKPSKKTIYWITGILSLGIFLNIGINQWIKHKLPTIIEEKNDTPYQFSFSKLRFSIFDSSILLDDVSVQPKPNQVEPLKLDFKANVSEIKILGVNFFKLLSKKDISAFSIRITEPKITLYDTKIKDSTQSNSKFTNSINISHFIIEKAQFYRIDSTRVDTLTKITDLDFELNGVNLTEKTLDKNIPFTYKTVEIKGGKMFHQVNPSQQITADYLKATDNLFSLQNLKMISTEKVARLNPKNLNYRLLPDIQAPNVSFIGMDWGFDKLDQFYFEADILKFDSIDLNFKNDKPLEEEKKDTATHILPFQLKIKDIQIADSRVRVGKSLDAKNINLRIQHVNNHNDKQIQIEQISLNHPEIISFSGNKTAKKAKTATQEFIDHISIKNVKVTDAIFKINEFNSQKNKLKIDKINFTLDEITITPESYLEKIPILYKNAELSANSLEFNPNPVYKLKTQKIHYKNGDLKVNRFEMKPKMKRSEFVRQLKSERDLYNISAENIQANLQVGFQGKDLFIKSPKLNLNQVDAHIYRSKVPPDDTRKKKMYSQLLRELPFILEVQQLQLKNSKLTYEEETTNSDGAGTLTFNNFNADIKNIFSGYKKKSLPDLQANISCNFMNDSKLTAIWTFNPMNRAEKFNIKGSIFNFDAKKMTPFIKPYLHATAVGNMHEVRFNFDGNDINANGKFGVKYENLKVTLYNPETGKERKVLNAIGNLFIKSHTKEKYNEVSLKTVERKQDRSFFNFFWLCVQQGLKQTILAI